MKKLYCNGKKGYCPHYDGNILPDCNVVKCKHFDNTGCEEIEDVFTNYDRIRNMSVDELAEFLMDWFMRCMMGKAPLNVKEWLGSEADEETERALKGEENNGVNTERH